MTVPTIGRRRFIQVAGGAALAMPVLSACGGDSTGNPTSNATGTIQSGITGGAAASSSGVSSVGAPTAAPSDGSGGLLPTHTPRQVVLPDLPATDTVPAGYLKYPANPTQLATSPPATGGTITVLKLNQSAVAPGEGQNQFWQQLNKRIGAELKVTSVLANDYWAKVVTTIAGGDLPDLTTFNTSSATPSHLGDVMKAKFQDLTSYLSGDSVKAYPNLAALQTIAWRSPIFDNKIYGVPLSLSVIGNTGKVRQDILEPLGLSATPSDGQDFLKLCQELTDEKKNRWALGRIPDAMSLVGEMIGSPNGWRVENGVFTSAYATDEYRQILDIVRQMWTAGYFQPDTLTANAAQIRTWFMGGTVPMMYTNYTDWALLTQSALPNNPSFKVGGFIPPKWDGGGQAGHYEVKGSYTFIALKKASDDKVRRLLKVLDWFASPFGSEEFLFLNYGIPGRDYNLHGTDPIETPTGVTECQNFEITYLAAPPDTLYIPGQSDLIRSEHDSLTQLMKVSVPLPTVGLISDTDQSKGASLSKAITNLYTDIIVGRKPLSAWDSGVKTWLAGGGAQIGHEYEEGYARRPS